MKKLLITGFEPFGGESINPSWEAVSRLPDVIGEYELTKVRLPVVFGLAAERALEVAKELSPDVILCIGQAGGRGAVTPEAIGINRRSASIPDNGGYQPKDEVISEDGDAAYFSTLPVRKMADAINAAEIRAGVSYSAGVYVCNDVLYSLLHHFDKTDVRVGFIHIPYSTEQGKTPAMEMCDIVRALTIAVENID
jgi:pyroglutamyl-peptidase